MSNPEINANETAPSTEASVPAAREPAPKKVTKTTAKPAKEPKQPKEPKEPKEPKTEWKPSDELAAALAVIKGLANAGDSKACAFAVKEAIASRAHCQAVRDSGANISNKAD